MSEIEWVTSGHETWSFDGGDASGMHPTATVHLISEPAAYITNVFLDGCRVHQSEHSTLHSAAAAARRAIVRALKLRWVP